MYTKGWEVGIFSIVIILALTAVGVSFLLLPNEHVQAEGQSGWGNSSTLYVDTPPSLLEKYWPVLYIEQNDYYPWGRDSILNKSNMMKYYILEKVGPIDLDDLVTYNDNDYYLDLWDASSGLIATIPDRD